MLSFKRFELQELKKGIKFRSYLDGKVYTFKKYTETHEVRENDWHDSHYDYDSLVIYLKIFVEEQKEPLIYTEDASERYGFSKDKIKKEIARICVGTEYIDLKTLTHKQLFNVLFEITDEYHRNKVSTQVLEEIKDIVKAMED